MNQLFLRRLILLLLLLGCTRIYGQGVHIVTSNADSGPGTLREVFGILAPNDTIRFAVRGRIVLTSGQLSFNNGFVMEGPGADSLTISGDSSSVVFYLNQGNNGHLSMSGLTIQAGTRMGIYAGLYNRITLQDVTLSKNYGRGIGGRGGGAYLWSGNITMRKCKFLENRVTNSVGSSPDGEGGGAFIRADNLQIDSCLFQDNIASASTGSPTGFGGALYFLAESGVSRMVVRNSTFIGNHATAFGSGSVGQGSAIYVYGFSGVTPQQNLVQVENCEFLANQGGGSYQSGSAIEAMFIDSLVVRGSTFSENTSAAGEGVIEVLARRDVIIEQSTFRRNVSGKASAVYCRGLGVDSLRFRMEDCVLDSNIAQASGIQAAVWLENLRSTDIRRTRFLRHNKIALRVETANLGDFTRIRDCEFANNGSFDINLLGSLIFSNPNSKELIENCTFYEGTGYAFFFQGFPDTVEVRHCTVAEKPSYVYLDNAKARFTNSIFTYLNTPPVIHLLNLNGSALLSGGGNMVRTGGLAGFLTAPSDLHNFNPQATVWGFNGGPTRTLGLLPSSQAIDHGGVDTLGTDQRGFLRDSLNDAGAFEFGASNPAQVVVTAQSGAATACVNDMLTLSVAAGGLAPLSYQWQLNGMNLPGETLSTISFAAVQMVDAGNYTCIVSNSSSADTSAVIALSVNALPSANAGVDQAICAGQSVNLAASGGTSYSWDQGLGSGASHTVTPAATTTYTVTVTDANSCSATDDVTVTVNALPSANAGANQAICAGQSVNLSASGGSTYTWNQGLGSGASHTVTPSATTTYTVTVTNANNCTATDDVTVTVNALPSANAGANQTICAGQSVNLSASGGTSYTWNQGLGSGASHTVTPSATTTYTVTVTNTNNCTATDDVTITVNALPTANAGIDQTICAGQSVNLSASGGSTYTWNQGLGAGASHTITPSATTTYTVTVTNANNCTATDDVTITVNALPTANAGANQTICAGQSVNLSASGGSTYTWNQGLGSGASHTITPSATTTYTVTVTNANNCTATDDVTITVNALPTVAFTGLASNYCTTDLPATLQGSPTGGNFFGPGISGPSFDPAQAGVGTHTIQYAYTDMNGCSDSMGIATTVSVCIGLGPAPTAGILYECYPNPAQDQLNIRFLEGSSEGWALQVYDVRGKRLLLPRRGDDKLVHLDLRQLSSGTYYLILDRDGQRFSQKIMKTD